MGGFGTYLEMQAEGFWELDRKLVELSTSSAAGARVWKRIVDDSLMAGARIIEAAIAARVPVRTGAMREALGVFPAARTKHGARIVSVGFYGSTMATYTARTYKSGRTGQETNLRYFYPAAVEYGHDVPYASARRFERGERIARSRSQSLNLSAAILGRMNESMRAHRLKLAARGQEMNKALAATKRIPAHPFVRPAFQASADQAADAIITSTIGAIQEFFARPSSGAA